ncbi:hypothetical protein D3C73_1358230 [compost metagenome]
MLHEAPDRAALVEDGAHQDAEGDEQADVHHDLAEAAGDGFDGFLDAEAHRQTEINGSEDQGNHRVDPEADDQQDSR